MRDISLRSIHDDCRIEVPVMVLDKIFYAHVRLSLRTKNLHSCGIRHNRCARKTILDESVIQART